MPRRRPSSVTTEDNASHSSGASGAIRRVGWLSLLVLFAEATKQGGIPQHRVRTAQREVTYLERRTRETISRFWIPHSSHTSTSSHRPRHRKLRSTTSVWESWTRSLIGKRHVFREDQTNWLDGGGGIVWSWMVHVEDDLEGSDTARNHDKKEKGGENGSNSFYRTAEKRNAVVVDKFVNDDSTKANATTTAPTATTSGSSGNGTSFNVSATIEYISVESSNSTLNKTGNVTSNHRNGSTHIASSVIFTAATAQTKPNSSNTNNDTSTSNESNNTVFPIYQPIRIRLVLSEHDVAPVGGDTFLTEWQRMYLFQEVLSPALLAWSSALRVDPVQGNLTVDSKQLYDGETCGPGKDSGLPSVPVPPTHMTLGVPDTDMLVYLSLGFVVAAGSSSLSSIFGHGTSAVASQSKPTDTPSSSSHLASASPTASDNNDQWFFQQQSGNSSNGSFPVTVEYLNWTEQQYSAWTAGNTSTSKNSSSSARNTACTGDYLASATFCSTDQFDRPTAAMLHLCMDDIFFLESSTSRNIITVMHELGHALGFNALSLAHFRQADGTPMTPRDENGDVPDQTVECTGPQHAQGRQQRQGRRASVALPSSEILQFRTVRGGIRVAEIVTPSVQQVARNHFSCQELQGAELESGDGSGGYDDNFNTSFDAFSSSCIGDHWSRLLFRMDVMNPIVDDVLMSPLISTITLAYFADSGWYQVDLSRAAEPYGWGRGAGCSFVFEKCITGGGNVLPSNLPFFCNDTSQLNLSFPLSEVTGCSPDLSSKAVCSIGSHKHPIPLPYRYFNESWGSNIGGNDPLMEFCPVYSALENGLCSVSQNKALLAVNQVELFGLKNSMCLSGTIHDHKTALCIPIACVVEDQSLRILVGDSWQLCEYKNQTIPYGDGAGIVLCPDPIRTCPTFYCNLDCLGTGGFCDYQTGECLCNIKSFNESGYLNGSCADLFGNGSSSSAQFYDASTTSRLLPGQESPLSDYYVHNTQDLKLPRADSNDILIIVLLVFVILLVLVMWWYEWRKQGVSRFWKHFLDKLRSRVGYPEQSPPPPGRGDNPLSPTARANKDKMVASVLVDLRVHDPSGLLGALATAETESESESDCSYLTEPEFDPVRYDTSSRSLGSLTDSAAFTAASAPENYVDPLQPDDGPLREGSPTLADSLSQRIIRRRNASRYQSGLAPST